MLMFLGLILFSACSSAKIISDIDQRTDFTQYKTYTWSPKEDPMNKNYPQFDNSLNRERFRDAIDMAMQNRGYILKAGEADLEVDFHLQFERNIVPGNNHEDEMGNPYIDLRPTSTTTYQYDQGTLIVHLVDLKENRIVWQGVATKVLDIKRLEEAEVTIQLTVDRMFEKLAKQLAKQTSS